MPEISKIKLPSGNEYEIKDATAREMISGGVSFIIAWDGSTTPVVGNIPAGVRVVYSGTAYTGTLSASDAVAGAFYLVKSSTDPSSESLDIYDEYVPVGSTGNKSWEKIGDTQLNLTDVVTGVSLSKQTDTVLGTSTTFTVTQPTISVTPSQTYLEATASGTAVGADGTATVVTGYATPSTDTFVKSVSAETGKNLVTTSVPNVTGNTNVSIPNVTGNTNVSIPNVTDVGDASTWSFTMGSGDSAETLIISGANSTTPTLGSNLSASKVTLGTNLSASKVTLGNAITVATGATSTNGTGDAVVTGVTIGSSASAITALGAASTETVLKGVKVTSQPTIALGTNSSSGTGRVQVATGISDASASGAAVSASGDNVTVLTNATDVSVTKGNA